MENENPAPPQLGTLESALYVDDLPAAIAFWEGVIGLQCFQHAPGRHAFFRLSQTPRPQVLLVFRADVTEQPPAADARLPAPPGLSSAANRRAGNNWRNLHPRRFPH